MFYSKRVEAKIEDIDLNYEKINIERISIKQSVGFIDQLDSNQYNFTFIIDSLKNNSEKKKNWKINCDVLHISNHKYKLSSDKNNYDMQNLYMLVENISIDSTNLNFVLNSFSTELNQQPFISNLSTEIKRKGNNINLINFKLNLPNSIINIPETFIILPGQEKTFGATYKTNIEHTQIALSDLAIFNSDFRKSNEKFVVSGMINGNNKSLSLLNVKIKTDYTTLFEGKLDIYNLAKPKALSYNITADKLITNRQDILHFSNTYFGIDSTKIPSELDIVGNIMYSGELKGTQSDITTNGVLLTKVGKLTTDFTLKKQPKNNQYYIDGELSAKPLFLNKISDNNKLGDAVFSVETTGTFSKQNGINLELLGNISSVSLNNQTIDSLLIDGKITDEQFYGRISSFDPKIRFDFEGLINYDSIPSYDFLVNVYNANLYQLKLDKDPEASLSFNANAKFIGNNFNNSTGNAIISDLFYMRGNSYLATDSISFTSQYINNQKQLDFYSEYIEGKLSGNYNTLTLIREIENLLATYLPALELKKNNKQSENNFNFEVIANYPHPVAEILKPGLKIASGTKISGIFNGESASLLLTGSSDHIKFKKQSITDFKIKAYTKNNQLYANFGSKSFNYTETNSLKNFLTSLRIKNDSIYINNNWNNWLENSYSGNLNSMVSLTKNVSENKPYFKLDIFPSNIIVLDTIWYVNQGFIKQDSSGIRLQNVKISNGVSSFEAQGVLSDNPEDSIEIIMQRTSMEHLNTILKKEKLKFQGLISGSVKLSDLQNEKKINVDFEIEDFGLNGERFGNTQLTTVWDKEKQLINVVGNNSNKNITTLNFGGIVSPKNKFIDIAVDINQQRLSVLSPYLQPAFTQIKGDITGNLRVFGDYKNPNWQGAIYGENAGFLVTPTHTFYNFNDSVFFDDHNIIFKNLTIYDRDKNTATLNGEITHEIFKYFSVDLNINTNRILGLNTNNTDNPLFYGSVYGSGVIDITGPTKDVLIEIAATTQDNSYFYIPLEGRSDIKENEFIEFVSHQVTQAVEQNNAENKTKTRDAITTIKADLTITPDAEIQIIFDPRIGDALKANGSAQLNLESKGKDFAMYGDYQINRGDFVFTLQNVINKRLEIEPGSTVSFSGHPLDAEIDLDAVYKVRKASVYDLTQVAEDQEKRIEVHCHLLMTDRLVNPSINFAINVPSATNVEAIDQLNSLPTEDLNKQVLSLLLVNKFIALDPSLSTIPGANSGGLGATTASELLSNQLSQWLSQITSSFDLGFTYRPGDEYTAQEYELALTTKFWDDRIIVNGNLGYADQSDPKTIGNNNPYTTDFQVELKVNKKGNIRLRAFQKVNNDIITRSDNPYKQGVGIFYTEEFNRFNDLLQKIFRQSAAKKPDEIEIEQESSN